MASFTLPPLQPDSPEALFGPSASNVPSQFKDIPFQTYSKSEKLGQVVDWSASLVNSQEAARPSHRRVPRAPLDGDITGLYGYRHEEDEASFSLVDGGRAAARGRPTGGLLANLNRSNQYARQNQRTAQNARGQARGLPNQGMRGFQRGMPSKRGLTRSGWGGRDWGRDQRSRESSVQISDKWNLLEEIEFSRLSKLRLDVETDDVDTLAQCGFLYEYDRTYDRVNTKNEKPLQHMERLHYNPTASDDPVLQELAASNGGKVFTTDTVLSMLMCANRSVYPWDIVLIREGDKLWMDKRDQGPLDYLSVNENAGDPPMEITQIDPSQPNAIINTPSALSQQATYVNETFAWQVVKESPQSRLDFDRANPFYDPEESEPLASCGYRYRRFDLATKEDEEIDLVVRTEVDALLRGSLSTSATAAPSASSEEETYITLKTLFEFDSRAQGSGSAPDWRTKLDSQRGAVVATEMKNNSLKLARWATTSILAGAGGMKIGYVSRANPRDESRHVILGTQWFKPRDLASQMNVSIANGWGIVRTIIDLCLKQKEGKYVLVKDPNKPVIRLYAVPIGTFEEGEDEEEVEDQDGAGSEY